MLGKDYKSLVESSLTPLGISTPKLTGIGENCVVDEEFLGVIILNNGNEFECM